MDPFHFGVSKTAEYITTMLGPQYNAKILDVGAGRGRLMKYLSERGFIVHGIDKSAKSVKAASDFGISVLEADIINFRTLDLYDCIVFCMSAHHFFPLKAALDQVKTLLKPNGILVFEEFGIEDADYATTSWFEQTRALAFSLGILECENDNPFKNLVNPLEAWQKEHTSHEDHHFNTGAELLVEVKERFKVLDVSRGPYFFRYLAAKFSEKITDECLAERLYNLEVALISAKQIKPLGLRIVARLP